MQEILNSLRLNDQMLRRMLNRIPQILFASQPEGLPNHPAWTLGHLCHSFEAIGTELGLSMTLPDDWDVRFGTGSTPQPDLGMYPAAEMLLENYGKCLLRLKDRLGVMSLQECEQPLPDERYRQTFPQVKHAVVHILACHFSFHLGQLSCWLRAMKIELPSELDERD